MEKSGGQFLALPRADSDSSNSSHGRDKEYSNTIQKQKHLRQEDRYFTDIFCF